MREKRWLLLALYGILLVNAVSGALKATRPKFKIATTSTTTTSTTTEEAHAEQNENEDVEVTTVSVETNGTTGHVLTGIPQIDYIWDPNLPRELNGYNLSEYPFYNSIPEDIDFKCDGLHDGFYASVPHKCQVYHHCLFGTRYDFLCANFTAFDQKTFICHFVSEVDCANSKKYWHRNDALYKATTTSTTSTSTTTTLPPVTAVPARSVPRDRDPPRRRRPHRRRPAYDYYDEEYYDDDYTRPRGYDRREDYDYEDRKYRRDRDRDFRDRDRDFRDRDVARPRDIPGRDERDRETNVRDRFPSRTNRRDPIRGRDPLEDDVRPRNREQDQGSRSREVDDVELDDRRIDTRIKDDDRRYYDKRFRDEYDDKEPVSAAIAGSADGLVKPAAPSSSVYARPRAPPKIRRPVPLSEQDKYAYKAVPPQSTEEPRRRPLDAAEDDYYDDELEEVRPIRRPLRRRPAGIYRDRDRDFYDSRDRDRDRPFRSRYHDEEDDIRPRKHPDRSRDRYYDRDRTTERSRDRGSLDRGKDRLPDRTLDRDRGKVSEADRQERPYSSRTLDRDRDIDRPRSSFRTKDLPEVTENPRRPSIYDRTAERTTATATTTTSTTSTTCLPEDLVRHIETDVKETQTERTHSDRQYRPQTQTNRPIDQESHREITEKPQRPVVQYHDYQEREEDRTEQNRQQAISAEEYSSEYYDEPEEPPAPPPRTAVRIVKRPFLPSRGGNPNPRGLQPVGSKAQTSGRRDENRTVEKAAHQDVKGYYVHEDIREDSRERSKEDKQTYDAYKVIQSDLQKQRGEEYDISSARSPSRKPDRNQEEERQKELNRGPTRQDTDSEAEVPTNKWTAEEYSPKKQSDTNLQNYPGPAVRGKLRLPPTESPTLYSSSYKSEDEQPTGPGGLRVKQRINEVTRLQDIPESEYDVTLNDALTPTLNQEATLPSGFVLPLHRQLNRDTALQSTENNYKLRAVNQQQSQKPFIPSPQFLPTNVNANDRQRTVYYRTPETIQISGAQYRQQRGPWHDYSGY